MTRLRLPVGANGVEAERVVERKVDAAEAAVGPRIRGSNVWEVYVKHASAVSQHIH